MLPDPLFRITRKNRISFYSVLFIRKGKIKHLSCLSEVYKEYMTKVTYTAAISDTMGKNAIKRGGN